MCGLMATRERLEDLIHNVENLLDEDCEVYDEAGRLYLLDALQRLDQVKYDLRRVDQIWGEY